MHKCTKLHVPAAELCKELVLYVHGASHLSSRKTWHGGMGKCGIGSVVHRRKSDRSHSDAAVLFFFCVFFFCSSQTTSQRCLCAGVFFSWARPSQQPNESWVSRRISKSVHVPPVRFAVVNLSAKYVQASRQEPINPRDTISGFPQGRSRSTKNDQKKFQQMNKCSATAGRLFNSVQHFQTSQEGMYACTQA